MLASQLHPSGAMGLPVVHGAVPQKLVKHDVLWKEQVIVPSTPGFLALSRPFNLINQIELGLATSIIGYLSPILWKYC